MIEDVKVTECNVLALHASRNNIFYSLAFIFARLVVMGNNERA
jgi:hypothetical protein